MTRLSLRPASPVDIYDIAINMRDRDYEDVGALTPVPRDVLASILVVRYKGRPDVFCVRYGDERVAILGGIEGRRNVVSMLFFATPAFKKAQLAFARFVRDEFVPGILATNVHRIEALVLDKYKEMHRWLRFVGATKEGAPLKAYGCNREDFVMFSIVKAADRPAGP